MENPYGSTVLAAEETATARADDSARAVFMAWEKLRLAYNAALALVTLIFGMGALSEVNFWRSICLGAFIANVCFCLGPVLEGYLSLIGLPRRPMRWLLFLLGPGLACLLAIGSIFSYHMRDFAVDV